MALTLVTAFPVPGPNGHMTGRKAQVCVCGGVIWFVCVCVRGVTKPSLSVLGERGDPRVERSERHVTLGPGSAPACLPSVLQGHVYRFCTADGLWLYKENSSLPWRDLSECEESKRGERVS